MPFLAFFEVFSFYILHLVPATMRCAVSSGASNTVPLYTIILLPSSSIPGRVHIYSILTVFSIKSPA